MFSESVFDFHSPSQRVNTIEMSNEGQREVLEARRQCSARETLKTGVMQLCITEINYI